MIFERKHETSSEELILRDSFIIKEKKDIKNKNLIYFIYMFPVFTLLSLLSDVLSQTVFQYQYECLNDIELVFYISIIKETKLYRVF